MKKAVIVIFFLLTRLFLTGQQPSQELGPMPDDVFEISGMVFYNGKLIAHNDSGNTAQLFEIDTLTLEITRTVTLTNIENNDWEDIAQDDAYIYIGDFGNYKGIRRDLAIYRIAKTDYNASDNIVAEKIDFVYEDQNDFTDTGISDWDAEALFVLDNLLIVLTKQLESMGTVGYSLPKTPGTYTAQRLDSYNVEGFVTGATYNPITEHLHIIGYDEELRPFLFQVSGADKNAVFGGNVSKTDFEISQAQVESIAYIDATAYFFSSEFLIRENPAITLPSLLYSFTISDVTDQEEQEGQEQEEQEQEELEQEEQEQEEQEQNESTEEEDGEESGEGQEPSNPETEPEGFKGEQLVIYRPFGSDQLQYSLNVEGPVFGMAIFDSSGRAVVNLPYNANTDRTVNISNLKGSIYYLTFYTVNGVVSKPFAGH